MRLKPIWFAIFALSIGACSAAADTIDPAQAIAQKFSEADQPKPAAQPERPSLDYEMDMLRRARTEELEREQQPIAKAPAEPSKVAEPAPLISPAPAVATTPPAEAAPAKLAAPEAPPVMPVVAEPPPAPAPPEAARLEDIPDSMFGAMPRATVLLVLEADGRTATMKPDPIICLEDRCWLSNGYEAPARPLLRSQAVALKSSAGATNDPCHGKSACVFRNIAFRPDSQIEVVELGDGMGTGDGAYTVQADLTCRKHDDELQCANGIVTREFRLWMIPEPVAQTAGPSKLEDAIVAGLPSSDSDPSRDK